MATPLVSALKLWIAKTKSAVHILTPRVVGMTEIAASSTPLLRARYLGSGNIEAELERVRGLHNGPNGLLLLRIPDSETPPASTALLFFHDGEEQIPCVVGTETKRFSAERYLAATSAGHAWSWNSDLAQGKDGYFLIVGQGKENLWKIRRVEIDLADRLVFTIAPLAPSNGLPSLDLSSIHDQEMRSQIEQHWREFVEVYTRQLPFRSINAAKDVCEFLMYDVLRRDGTISGGKHELGDLLKRLLGIFETGKKVAVPFTLLHFHMMQKIRVLHGQLHAGKVASQGAVDPEVAFSVATDLVEVLRAAGLVIK